MVTFDGLRSQVQLHNYIAKRDLPKRFATIQFLLYWIWAAGQPGLGDDELRLALGYRGHHPGFDSDDTEGHSNQPWRIAALLICSVLASLGYYAPGVVLALNPDFGLAIGGIAWILAALSTCLVMYNALPAFYWSTAIAGFPAALCVIFFANGQEVTSPAPYTWLLPTSIILLYIVNTVQQLRDYRDTHRELATTRAELLQSLRKLKHMSLHDGLTGLQNRAAFQDKLTRMLARAGPDRQLGVLMIDLNGFKPINDTYGHEAGDAVLVAVAKRMDAALRPEAEAFRLGGDEFALLSFGADEAEFQTLGNRMIEEIRIPIPFEETSLMIGASVGIATTATPSKDVNVISAEADQAMYLAKTS